MSHIDRVVNRILEGADVRSVITEFDVQVGGEKFDIDPFKNDGKEFAKGAGPEPSSVERGFTPISELPIRAVPGGYAEEVFDALTFNDDSLNPYKCIVENVKYAPNDYKLNLYFKNSNKRAVEKYVKQFIKQFFSSADFLIRDIGDVIGEDFCVVINTIRLKKDGYAVIKYSVPYGDFYIDSDYDYEKVCGNYCNVYCPDKETIYAPIGSYVTLKVASDTYCLQGGKECHHSIHNSYGFKVLAGGKVTIGYKKEDYKRYLLFDSGWLKKTVIKSL